MEIWGITGLAGTGKSTAIRYLGEKGYPTFDADRAASIVVDRNTEAGKEGFEKIYKLFGASVLNSLGQLDKRAMLKRILTNPADKERLESIVDPLVLRHIEREGVKWKQTGAPFAFIEGSRLAEAGLHRIVSRLIVIEVDFQKRVSRVSKRDTMGKLEVEALFSMQDDDLMKRVAKVRWNNNGTEAAFKKTIDAFLAERLEAQRKKAGA